MAARPLYSGICIDGMGEGFHYANRIVLSGSEVVVWGNTDRPNGTDYTIDFGDGDSSGPTPIADQSYIAEVHTYTTALPVETFDATLTVINQTKTVTITVIDPDALDAEQLLEANIETAIEDGLRSQYVNQANRAVNFANGEFASWSISNDLAYTSLALLAFENHGYNPGGNGIYSELVQRGLNTLIDHLTTVDLSDDGPGDPCAEIYSGASYGDPMAPGPDCTGLGNNDFDQGYKTAVIMLAIAGSGAPNAIAAHGTDSGDFTIGMTYLEIVQRLINTIAFAQFNGGWIYGYNNGNDGSTNGWNALAILDGGAFGATIPDFMLAELDIGTEALTVSIDPMADNFAAMGYRGPNSENTAKAGIRLQALNLIGYAIDEDPAAGGPPAQATVDYINAGWKGRSEGGFACFGAPELPQFQDTSDGNNFGCLYAMFNVFKGLKLFGIDTIANSSRADLDWHREYKDYLVQTQQNPTMTTGGDWGNLSFSCCSSDMNGETALALLVLSESATILRTTSYSNLICKRSCSGIRRFWV